MTRGLVAGAASFAARTGRAEADCGGSVFRRGRGSRQTGGMAMSRNTVTRATLAEAIYRKVGLSRTESRQLVGQVLDLIIDALDKDELVKLSSFGTFRVRHKKARIGRNPRTKEEAVITPRRVPSFKASPIMKARLNGEGED